jgi:hypothetical protein
MSLSSLVGHSETLGGASKYQRSTPPPVDRLGIVMAAESAQKTSGSTYVKKPNSAADKLKD